MEREEEREISLLRHFSRNASFSESYSQLRPVRNGQPPKLLTYDKLSSPS